MMPCPLSSSHLISLSFSVFSGLSPHPFASLSAGIECSLAARPLRICAFVTHQHNRTTAQRQCPACYNNDYCKDKSRHLQQSCTNDKRVAWQRKSTSGLAGIGLLRLGNSLQEVAFHSSASCYPFPFQMVGWGEEFPVSLLRL